jgi:hypothetical protein
MGVSTDMKKLLVSMFLVCLLATVLPAAVILSGSTTDTIQFYAVQSSDHITPYTAGSSFTVYYSIDGGTATAMDTPTVTALDTTYMPGWYKLLVDEALMTVVPSGHDATNLALHITHASMDPVAREVEVREPLSTIAEVQSGLALETKQDTIIAKTNNLPASPAAVGSQMNLADDAITAAKYDQSTAHPQPYADLLAVTVPGAYGADTVGYILGNSAELTDLEDAIASDPTIAKLDSMIESDGSTGWEYTAGALVNVSATGVALTADTIDDILDEVIKGAHEVYGTLGWYLNAILGGQ